MDTLQPEAESQEPPSQQAQWSQFLCEVLRIKNLVGEREEEWERQTAVEQAEIDRDRSEVEAKRIAIARQISSLQQQLAAAAREQQEVERQRVKVNERDSSLKRKREEHDQDIYEGPMKRVKCLVDAWETGMKPTSSQTTLNTPSPSNSSEAQGIRPSQPTADPNDDGEGDGQGHPPLNLQRSSIRVQYDPGNDGVIQRSDEDNALLGDPTGPPGKIGSVSQTEGYIEHIQPRSLIQVDEDNRAHEEASVIEARPSPVEHPARETEHDAAQDSFSSARRGFGTGEQAQEEVVPDQPGNSQRLPERTIRYEEVLRNTTDPSCTTKSWIVQYPPRKRGVGHAPPSQAKSETWWILRCPEHGKYFTDHPLRGAGKHLNGAEHGQLSRSDEVAIRELGWRVLDCTAERAKDNNDKWKEVRDNGTYHPTRPFSKAKPAATIGSSSNAVVGSVGDGGYTRESRSRSRQNEKETQFSGIIDPVVGEIYQASWWNRTRHTWYLVAVLPLHDWSEVGIQARLPDSKLALPSHLYKKRCDEIVRRARESSGCSAETTQDHGLRDSQDGSDSEAGEEQHETMIPRCYTTTNGEITGWADGYEDGGTKVRERQFPCLFLQSGLNIPPVRETFQLPERQVLAWIKARNLRPRDSACPGIVSSSDMQICASVAHKFEERAKAYKSKRLSRGRPGPQTLSGEQRARDGSGRVQSQATRKTNDHGEHRSPRRYSEALGEGQVSHHVDDGSGAAVRAEIQDDLSQRNLRDDQTQPAKMPEESTGPSDVEEAGRGRLQLVAAETLQFRDEGNSDDDFRTLFGTEVQDSAARSPQDVLSSQMQAETMPPPRLDAQGTSSETAIAISSGSDISSPLTGNASIEAGDRLIRCPSTILNDTLQAESHPSSHQGNRSTGASSSTPACPLTGTQETPPTTAPPRDRVRATQQQQGSTASVASPASPASAGPAARSYDATASAQSRSTGSGDRVPPGDTYCRREGENRSAGSPRTSFSATPADGPAGRRRWPQRTPPPSALRSSWDNSPYPDQQRVRALRIPVVPGSSSTSWIPFRNDRRESEYYGWDQIRDGDAPPWPDLVDY